MFLGEHSLNFHSFVLISQSGAQLDEEVLEYHRFASEGSVARHLEHSPPFL